MVKLVVATLVAYGALGCPYQDDTVGEILGNPLAAEHVTNVLRHAGIRDIGIMGSTAYGVTVGAKDVVRARLLLSRDKRDHPYFYNYHSLAEVSGQRWHDPSKWEVKTFNLTVSDILKLRSVKSDGNLRGIFREVQEEAKMSSVDNKPVTPFVKDIRLLKIEYMDASGKLRPAYKADFRWYDQKSTGSFGAEILSWDNGRKHLPGG